MQKITPHLWFDDNAEEAMDFYKSVFKDVEIGKVNRYPVEAPGIEGDVITGTFKIAGYELMVLNGGPEFKFNPSVSLFVNIETEAEVDELYSKLSEGGSVLMELAKYDFSKKYAWVNDKYGVSWQLFLSDQKFGVTPAMLFVNKQAGKAEEAINFYTSLFEDSKISQLEKYKEGEGDVVGRVKFGAFTLAGENFIAMDSGFDHKFDFNEAISFFVDCKDQAEVDKYWNKLTADGGVESQCGWLKDKYGMSWQIAPRALDELMSDPDPEKAQRVMKAMLKMKKIIVADLEKAYKGE
jgi:predicted 3-demethylubiquinone-9 3-methyltransferase (glyoxalase superfamily)